MKILGWIGLGYMGKPMSYNILKAGHQLNIFNRSKSKEIALIESGAKSLSTPKEIVDKSDIIFLMLSDSNAINDVLTQSEGILEATINGKIVINMSTISPSDSIKFSNMIKEKGGIYLDSPVSGSVGAATSGELVILASGDKNCIDNLSEYFNILGKRTIYFGEVGKGSSAKLAINSLLGIIGQGVAESIILAEQSGIKKDDFFDLISSSAVNTPFFQMKKEMYKTDIFPAAFMIDLISKDLGLAVKESNKLNLNLPLINKSDESYKKAKENGKGKLDIASIYLELKEQ